MNLRLNNCHFLGILFSLFLFSTATQAQSPKPISAENYQRIVSLSPHLTELIYSAGAGSKLVGVIEYSDFPIEAKQLPIVGSYNAINIEKIIQLQPDLIISWQSGNRLQDIERLQSLGFKLWQTDIKQLDDIPALIKTIGQKTNNQTIAEQEATRLQQLINKTANQYQGSKAVTTFYEIWHKPLMTVNGQQYISLAMQLCGAKNIFADLSLLAPEVNIETILEKDPQLILIGGEAAFQQAWLDDWQNYSELNAIKHQQIYKLANNRYQRPTARLIDALPDLCQTVDRARKVYQ